MKVSDIVDLNIFKVVNEGKGMEKEITIPFCCDLLSIAMSKAPAGSAWVTVMGNVNTLAVAELADVGCVILAEGMDLDIRTLEKAKEQQITVFSTPMSIFEAAVAVNEKLNG